MEGVRGIHSWDWRHWLDPRALRFIHSSIRYVDDLGIMGEPGVNRTDVG
jgi:hypothetical protein